MDDTGDETNEAIKEAQALLERQRYKEAARVIDNILIREKNRDELWYLRGIISLKLKNYELAHECFEHALSLGKKPKYYQIKGMAHFEVFEIDAAIDAFCNSLALEPNDVTTNFFLAISYLFQDDPRSDEYLRKARALDAKKTRQLLLNFYALFLKGDPKTTDAQKKRIEEQIRRL